MSTVTIDAIDVHDQSVLHAWWDAGREAQAERPVDLYPAWEFSRVALPAANPEFETVLLAARIGDEVVGQASLQLPQNDNTHMAYADLGVRPAYRRQGIGNSLLEEVERRAREAGRTHVLLDAHVIPGETGAGPELARARGYAQANLEEQKVIDLAASEAGFAALEAEAAAKLGDYRIVTWNEETPEEHIDGYCALLSGFLGEIPLGDVALEDGEWTRDRIRANEKRAREIGRFPFVAAAIAPDGAMAGVTDLRLSKADPGKAFIGITMVARAHRGHALGLSMKLATHRALRAAYPECAFVATSNAGVNDHMNAINERMGYRVVEHLLELQKVL